MAARTQVIVDIVGTVQGVGFRPSVQLMAEQARLSGWVQNRAGTVRLALAGPPAELDAFLAALPERLPPAACVERIVPVSREVMPDGPDDPTGEGAAWSFEIRPSEAEGAARVSIPADRGLCAECRAELFDPASRFFGYPFVTCTACGPRFTVVTGTPYDRAQTTLARFVLCWDCERAYRDLRDRRFHAESIACPACGPRLRLLDPAGHELAEDRPPAGDGRSAGDQAAGHAALRQARARLHGGQIVALRGLGGFQLAVNACDPAAVARLRQRKGREGGKALAVMAADEAAARALGAASEQGWRELRGPARPILIVSVEARRVADAGLPLRALSPDTDTLGLMLPTTPLHELLFWPLPGDPTPALRYLVMTSGNRGGAPICTTADQALAQLGELADAFLVHDREIAWRCDDAVLRDTPAGPQAWRRSRGYVPQRLRLARPLARPVLAMGAELKNTLALGQGPEVVLSAHIGDLETPEANDALDQVLAAFPGYFALQPAVVAVDLHPDMHSARAGRAFAAGRGLPVVAVQHHHAHAAAALAEHGLDHGLALVFDGTGLGPDGAIWGAELLACQATTFLRLATFTPVPLPGGDAAVREPARQLIGRRYAAREEPDGPWLAALGLAGERARLWWRQCERGLNAPLTHAAGRLFDAAAALLGLAPARIGYEGQAAIRLEAAALRALRAAGQGLGQPSGHPSDARGEAPGGGTSWGWTVLERDGLLTIDWSPGFCAGPPPRGAADALALAFHVAVADAACAMVAHGRQATGWTRVVLSGGVFMNQVLTALVTQQLSRQGLSVYSQAAVPPNDGGIAFGQAVIAGGGL